MTFPLEAEVVKWPVVSAKVGAIAAYCGRSTSRWGIIPQGLYEGSGIHEGIRIDAGRTNDDSSRRIWYL